MTTLLAILDGFKGLEKAGFKRPEIPKDMHDLAVAYHEDLGDLSDELLAETFARYRREEGTRFWPKIAELRKLSRVVRGERGLAAPSGLQAEYLAWEKAGYRNATEWTPCPVCGSVVEPQGRIRVLHDRRRHAEAGVRFFDWTGEQR